MQALRKFHQSYFQDLSRIQALPAVCIATIMVQATIIFCLDRYYGVTDFPAFIIIPHYTISTEQAERVL